MRRIELHDGFFLGPIREGDQAAYVEHFADKETTDCLLEVPYPYTQRDADAWVGFRLETAGTQAQETSFALRRADGFLIGGAGLVLHHGFARHRANLGYWVAKDYRRRGLATAAARALVAYAFRDLGLKRIEATAFAGNFFSHRVLEKAGLTREGWLAGYHFREGALLDCYLYAILDRSSGFQ